MNADAIPTLFDTQVAVTASAGTTLPEQVGALSPLHVDETPLGYDAWAEKRKREFRAGRHHARRALLAAGGPASSILRDNDGVPIFPAGFSGSITHTGRHQTYAAAVIVGERAQVGLDAEELRELPLDMVAHILTEEERRTLSRSTKMGLGSEGAVALLAFSAKEAFYKCLFPRLRCQLGFHDAEFRHLELETDAQPGVFQVNLLRNDMPEAPEQLFGRYFRDGDRIVCGVTWLPQ
jgi:4'-phosphopantetheinyl transferase EntD